MIDEFNKVMKEKYKKKIMKEAEKSQVKYEIENEKKEIEEKLKGIITDKITGLLMKESPNDYEIQRYKKILVFQCNDYTRWVNEILVIIVVINLIVGHIVDFFVEMDFPVKTGRRETFYYCRFNRSRFN